MILPFLPTAHAQETIIVEVSDDFGDASITSSVWIYVALYGLVALIGILTAVMLLWKKRRNAFDLTAAVALVAGPALVLTPLTSFGVLLHILGLGLAAFLFRRRRENGWWRWVAIAAPFVGLMTLFGFAYDVYG